MSYGKPPVNPEIVLRLIARVPTGRTVLASFLGIYRSGRVVFEPYEASLLARLREALGDGQPVGACFIAEEGKGKIHYDPAAPTGVLAPFLLHEMVHASDVSLWAAAGKPLARRARDRLMLAAETRAFELQHRFVQELRAVDAAFDAFLVGEQSRVRVLHERLTEKDVAELYEFEN